MPKTKTKKEKPLNPVINYFEERAVTVAAPALPTTPCANAKHLQFFTRPDIGIGVCLVCNPDYAPDELSSILHKPGMRLAYETLRAGQECYALACLQRRIHADGIGHGWCDKHKPAAIWLREGHRIGFPRLETGPGTVLQEGRDAWVGNARSEAVDIMSIRAAQVYAPDFLELKKFFDTSWEEIGADWGAWLESTRPVYQEAMKIIQEKGGHDGEVEEIVSPIEEVKKAVVTTPKGEDDDDIFEMDYINFS